MRSFFSTSTPMLLLFALVLLTPSLAHAQKKSSSGLVTAADIAKYPNDPLERIIARMVSGVQVVRDDNGNNILQIRGAITIPDRESGAQFIKHPLYVVDGMAVHTPDGTLPDLEPQDLDSVRVLKGAEATAFGIEGSDGVIVFTTRRGKLRSK